MRILPRRRRNRPLPPHAPCRIGQAAGSLVGALSGAGLLDYYPREHRLVVALWLAHEDCPTDPPTGPQHVR